MSERVEFFRTEYQFELERRDKINESVSIPLAVVVALASALYYIYQEISEDRIQGFDYWILIGVLSGLACLLVTSYYLAASYHSKTYAMISDAETFRGHSNELDTLYAEWPGASDEEWCKALIIAYSDASMQNREKNNAKSANLYASKTWMLIAMSVTLICAISFGVHNFEGGEKIHKVQLVSVANTNNIMGKDQQRPTPPPPPATVQQRTGERPVAPPPPRTQVIKENTGKPVPAPNIKNK